jgi:hypothetical protein
MRKSSAIIGNSNRLLNRVEVTRRYRSVTELNMAFRANKLPVFISLIDLVVENSTVIQRRSDVATFRATTRFHRDFSRFGYAVTLRTLQIRVSFMSKRASRASFAPGSRCPPIYDADLRG